jgi:hypothetical protein
MQRVRAAGLPDEAFPTCNRCLEGACPAPLHAGGMNNTRLIAAAVVLAGFGPAIVALAANGIDDPVRTSAAPAGGLLNSVSSSDHSRSSSPRRGDDRVRGRGNDD